MAINPAMFDSEQDRIFTQLKDGDRSVALQHRRHQRKLEALLKELDG